MTVPSIPERTLEGAISDIIESIALEEAALAHLINAEAEKVQLVAGMENITPEQLVSFQQSVTNVLKTIIKKEMLLQFKLDSVLELPGFEVTPSP